MGEAGVLLQIPGILKMAEMTAKFLPPSQPFQAATSHTVQSLQKTSGAESPPFALPAS